MEMNQTNCNQQKNSEKDKQSELFGFDLILIYEKTHRRAINNKLSRKIHCEDLTFP